MPSKTRAASPRTTVPSFDPDAPASGRSGIYGLPFTATEARVVILPVPFEATTSYGGGTSKGPAAMLKASRQVDLFDAETGRPYAAGISMLKASGKVKKWNRKARALAKPVIDAAGDIGSDRTLAAKLGKVNEISGKLNSWVYETSRALLADGKMVVVLGGDHSVPLGSLRAHGERFPGIGILHLDAHADLREAYEGFTYSHASIFYNVMNEVPQVGKLVQVGVRDIGSAENRLIEQSNGRIVTFFDAQLAAEKERGVPWATLADRIVAELPEKVYLSWDIDGLDPTLCPHTGTPVPGGLSWNEAIGLLRAIVRSGKEIVGLDLCEVAPGKGEWDANVGARLLYKMIGFALLTSERSGGN